MKLLKISKTNQINQAKINQTNQPKINQIVKNPNDVYFILLHNYLYYFIYHLNHINR